ncbi:MAG: ARMT1-like domain-containing protein, partial [Eubacterium sp.]|nr:ARMT1-like domain-containing protein [Eubacterium sp.]
MNREKYASCGTGRRSVCLKCLMDAQIGNIPETVLEEKRVLYMQRLMKMMSEVKPEESAPVYAARIYDIQEEVFGEKIDYSETKKYFNDLLLGYEEEILRDVHGAADPLTRALQYSMIGNYIDFAVLENVNAEKLKEFLSGAADLAVDEAVITSMKADLEKAGSLVFLHDNCGEIVLDKILIETVRELYPQIEVTSVVRGFPVVNDVLLEDAEQVGLTKIAKIIENGDNIAGNSLVRVSEETLDAFEKADILFAKGQGNLETMLGNGLNVYYI